ncbi:hypothetical protein EVAR_21037_1 [Eumeta japonica]|uniref:Uncharacterized protein n=1 Tax=Eumeta variegata TaxID=151549 RepID=A0A4C1V1P6_EUMVA|nr:hypothetical protein EVAR_21037_1 [Eumeta japonica]
MDDWDQKTGTESATGTDERCSSDERKDARLARQRFKDLWLTFRYRVTVTCNFWGDTTMAAAGAARASSPLALPTVAVPECHRPRRRRASPAANTTSVTPPARRRPVAVGPIKDAADDVARHAAVGGRRTRPKTQFILDSVITTVKT